MNFSIPIDIAFQVLNEFMKKDVPYKKCMSENEDEVFNIVIAVDDDFSDKASEIINNITGGQKTRSQQWQQQ